MKRLRSDLVVVMILLAKNTGRASSSAFLRQQQQFRSSSVGSVGASLACQARPVRRIPRLGWRTDECPEYFGVRREPMGSGSPRYPHLPQSPCRRFYSPSPPTWQSTTTGGLFMSTVDEDETETASSSTKSLESTWNIPGLRKEVVRSSQRCFKKIGKANERLTRAKQTVEELISDPNATLEALEQCPNVDACELELKELQQRMRHLNALNEALSTLGKKASMILPPDICQLALDLGVNDQPPTKPERQQKAKGPRRDAPFRRPYRRYYSFGNIEIRVGKKAEDNDELTLSPEHRDGSDWWMHAAGCPGSHVVIRCGGQENLSDEVVQDAAALAARQSKCTGSVIQVSMTRCRDITKPPGAKAGLVMLTGKVRTVSVNMKEAESRLQRLEETVQVN